MLRRITLTAAATIAAIAGMASGQVPHVILNGSPSTSSSPASILTDGNTFIGRTTKNTLGVSGGFGTITPSPILTTGLVLSSSGDQVLASGDGTVLVTLAEHGAAGLPAPVPAPSPITFSATDPCIWYSADSGANWSRMPLFSSQGRCGGALMTLYDVSTDGRYFAGQGWTRVVYNAGANASNCTTNGWIFDRVTNTLTTLSDTFGGPTGQQKEDGRATFIVRSMSDNGGVVVGTAQGLGGETPVVWERDGGGNYVPTRLTSSINVGGSRECRVSRDGSTIIGVFHDYSAVNGGGVKWTKGGGTWTATSIPTNVAQVASNVNRPTSWLTYDPTGQSITPTAVSQDGSVIAGMIAYDGGGSSAAFIWTAATGTVDLYDYIVGLAGDTTGITVFTSGVSSTPAVVKKDPSGNIVMNVSQFLGVNAVIKFQATAICYPPVFLNSGTAPVISACASSPSINPGAASGTGPFSYVWLKDGSPVTLGPTIWGSNITMNNPPTLNLSNAQAPDAGAYVCRATGALNGPCLPGLTADSPTMNVTNVVPIQYSTDPSQNGDTCVGAVDLTSAVAVNTTPVTNFPALTVATLPRTMTAWNTCSAVNNNIVGASCVGNSNGDVWFKWTPDANVTVRLSTCNVTAPAGTSTASNTMLSVYTAGPGTLPNGADCTGTEIACNDTTISAFCSSTQRAGIDQLALTGGQTYFFRVAVNNPFTSNGTNYASLTITDFSTLVLPANDTCATATVLLPSTNTAFSTVNAGTEVATVSCNPALGSGKDVWFAFSPASSGDYRISLCQGAAPGTTPPVTNPSPSWNSIVTVFDACNGNEIACNDDQGGVNPSTVSCSSSNVGRISRVALNSGFTYYIRVAGINGALGSETNATPTGNINIFQAPSKPANDDCLNAIAVSTGGAQPWTVTDQSAVEATLDGANTCGPAVSTNPDNSRDLWFTFTPPSTPANGWRIQFCGQTWGDTGLSVHTGCPGDASNEVVGGCNNNVGNYASALPSACGTNNNSRIDSVVLTQGVTYYIRAVTNTFSSSGTTVSTLTIGETPAGPANDNCSGASIATVGTNAYNFNEATSQTLAACDGSGQRGAYDLWYTFTPSCTGTFSFLGCAGFSSPIRWNPVISVYPTCTDAINTPSVTLGCAEDNSISPFPTLMGSICPSSVNYPTALVQNVTLQGGTPVLVRVALQDYATNPLPSSRAQDPTGNFYIVQNVLCCRGTTCTQTTTNPEAACASPAPGIGASKTACGATCTGTTFAGCCFADFNHDGVQSIDDLFLYFNAYFTSSPWADFGGDGTSQPTIDDLFLYINAYFGTCS